jgi:FMN phosphatase YigB (HAD superfamily)
VGAIEAVVFDIGETILDRSREYAAWAAFFGVPSHTFSAVFGAMIAEGATVAQVIERFGQGRSFDALAAARRGAGFTVDIGEEDLYPDVRATIAELRGAGFRVGIVGNQPASVGRQLESLRLGADFVGSSATWGVSKPSPEFFAAVCAAASAPPAAIVYVGDQLQNDVVAPRAAGLQAVRIIRGPWGYLTGEPANAHGSLAVIESLRELKPILDHLSAVEHRAVEHRADELKADTKRALDRLEE